MAAINLYHVNTLDCGTKRLQSQLYIGKTTADFIMDKDGIVKFYDNGKNGFDYYPYKGEYKIVNTLNEMKRQPL